MFEDTKNTYSQTDVRKKYKYTRNNKFLINLN